MISEIDIKIVGRFYFGFYVDVRFSSEESRKSPPSPQKTIHLLDDVKDVGPLVLSDCFALQIDKQAQHVILLYMKIEQNFNLLAPELFFFSILAHPVYKM